MITITGLMKTYGCRRVLDGLDLSAAPGQITLLVGANGCGKTTTLRQVCGLSSPDSGRVVIGTSDLAVSPRAALAQLSFLPQSPRFHPKLTAGTSLQFYARLRGLPSSRIAAVEAQWGSPMRAIRRPRACPAARASVWRSPCFRYPTRRYWCSTSPGSAWIQTGAASFTRSCGQPHAAAQLFS